MSNDDSPVSGAPGRRPELLGGAEYRRLRRRINKLLNEVGVPDPWDIREFIQRLAAYRGRPIELLVAEIPPGGPDAIWVPTENVDVILYDSALREGDLHWEQVLAHEAAHILLCHRGDEDAVLARGPLDEQLREVIIRYAGEGAAGDRVLHRETYSSHQETEAEVGASLIWKAAGRRLVEPERHLHGEDLASIDALAEIMGRTRA
ncbi:hypothetical protein AB0J55_33765 [Amycolatopsis sp. NPDC049688]|uniref:hypothetical protein n=1 Tax=Amycolatopsis sp. NPDC049688 TaxID=3154733 RepID=UPI00341430CA